MSWLRSTLPHSLCSIIANASTWHFFFSLQKTQHCSWCYSEPANCLFNPESCRALEMVMAQPLTRTNLSKFGLTLKNPEIWLWWHVSPSRWLLMTFSITLQVKHQLWVVTLLLQPFRVEVFNIPIFLIRFWKSEYSWWWSSYC